MSKYAPWIKQYFHDHPNFTYPVSVLNEMENNFLTTGLEDLSVSRVNFDWGIRIRENDQHVIYVWIDALFNYVTALGYTQHNSKNYKKYWEDKNCEVVHVIGKDIARFHTIFWPIMLHSLDMRIPDKVLTHAWIMAEDGRKMSKSFGNVIDPLELVNTYGSDAVRYYMGKEMVFEADNNFSISKLVSNYNSDLANVYGNIVNRTISMVNLYFKGKVHKVNDDKCEETMKLLSAQEELINTTNVLINELNVRGLLMKISEFGRTVNRYIEDIKPWELKRDGKIDKLSNFLFYLVDAVRVFTILLSPVLVNATKSIKKQMRFTTNQLLYKNIDKNSVIQGHSVGKKPSPIFVRIK